MISVQITKMIAICLVSSTLLSCANKINLEQTNTFNEQTFIETHQKQFVSERILLLADNQKAMTLTEPVFEQSMAAESTVNTAHRRPSLDEFSLDVMEYILNKTGHDIIIHGGDLLNNSCLAEFEKSVKVLNSFNSPWFIAPGNHDGYYLGIASPMHISRTFNPFRNGLLDERAGWALACADVVEKKAKGTTGFFDIKNYEKYEDNVVDKRTFNRLYLNELGVIRASATEVITDLDGEYENYKLVCKSFEGNLHRGYLEDICWTEFKSKDGSYTASNNFTFSGEHGLYDQWEEFTPWKNFVVQKLEITFQHKRIEVFILDTSSYTNQRAVNDVGEYRFNSFGAADAGNITQVQQQILRQWLNKSTADEIILVGHHPLLDFDETSFEFISTAKNNYPISMYISGDTHDGYDVTQRISDDDTFKGIREVNLGSTIDAPLEYAQIGETKLGETLLKRYSLTPVIETRNGKKGLKKTALLKGKPKNYLKFDDEMWNICFENRWEHNHSNDVWNPLGNKLIRRFSDFSPFKRPATWLGLHYIFNPMSVRDIRNKSLESYKITRLVYLSEVYHNMLISSETAKTEVLKTLENQVETQLNYIRGKEYDIYRKHGYDPLNHALVLLSKLIHQYRIETSDDSKFNNFKVCSALYDAETEYRDSFLEKLSD